LITSRPGLRWDLERILTMADTEQKQEPKPFTFADAREPEAEAEGGFGDVHDPSAGAPLADAREDER
jgi:hypothetical protein